MGEDAMLKAVQSAIDSTREWTVTKWLHDMGSEQLGRVVLSKDGKSRMVLGEHYCQMLGMTAGETIYAKDGDSVARIGEDADARFLMPMRVGDLTDLAILAAAA